MVANLVAGGAAVNVLARHVGASVVVVDAGVAGDLPEADGLIAGMVRPGDRRPLGRAGHDVR